MTTPSAPPAEDADRILLVDDDVTNLDALRHTLDNRGYRLFVTRNGESAIEVARRVQPLLILLDVVMPGIDGYETCRRLKADPATREAAVIFLSSLDDTRDKVRGLEAGAVDYVVKGNMIGGFGLVAYPAEYGNSGIMTFIINNDGDIYQKDLGRRTARLAARMSSFSPDHTWKKVVDTEVGK